MKTPLLSTAVAASILTLGLMGQTAHGQVAPSVPNGTNVAVIDVPFIFKNNTLFKGQIADIKKDIDAYKAFVTEEQKKMRAQVESLGKYKAGSLEYKQIDERIARMKADLELEARRRQKSFMEREARVYYNAYSRIQQEVREIAGRNRIGLVLRFSREQMDPDKRETIMQGINRLVVHQAGLDITDPVLMRLNASTASTATRPVGPQIPRGPVGNTGVRQSTRPAGSTGNFNRFKQ